MNLATCQRCGADVPILNLSAPMKQGISGMARRNGRIQAIIELKDQAGLGLAEAKSVALPRFIERAAQQALAADGAIACFSSSLLTAAWMLIAPQLKRSVGRRNLSLFRIEI